jgi:polyferredoxin
MSIKTLRLTVQHVAFVILTFGGNFGIYIGSSVPCLSCPFIASCGGGCYLMAYQRAMGWVLAPFFQAVAGTGSWGVVLPNIGYFLSGLLVFAIFVLILGKSWCGWVCPFGVFQDWVTRLRELIGIRESEFSEVNKARISRIKYVLLIYLTAMPLAYSAGLLPRDFVLAFCNICPAKILMPLTTLNPEHMGISSGQPTARGVFSIILVIITGGMLVGMFLKERFFCLVCPMLAMINLFNRFHLTRLIKDPTACRGCGNCRRTCAMDNHTIYEDRTHTRVYDPDCLGCFRCAEGCASEGSLKIKTGPLTLFSSSPRHAIRALGGKLAKRKRGLVKGLASDEARPGHVERSA